MSDPFDALRLPVTPLDPDPEFARDLRRRLEAALHQDPARSDAEENVMTSPSQAHPGPHVPAHRHAITPYLSIRGAAAAIDYYVDIFGAEELGERIIMPDGTVGHCELRIGDSVIALADEFPEEGMRGPDTLGATTVLLHLYVPDADATMEAAVAAGATQVRPVTVQYGARMGKIRDPFGHYWFVSTHLPEEPPA